MPTNKHKRAAVSAGVRGPYILIVGPDPLDRLMAAFTLAAAGYRVVEARDAAAWAAQPGPSLQVDVIVASAGLGDGAAEGWSGFDGGMVKLTLGFRRLNGRSETDRVHYLPRFPRPAALIAAVEAVCGTERPRLRH